VITIKLIMGELVGYRREEASEEETCRPHTIERSPIKDELTLPGNQCSVLIESGL